jgi:hemerythrin-like metal-binding protein
VTCFSRRGIDRAIEAKAPLVKTREHLHELAAHREDRFSHEEWLMQSVGYPAFGWHRQQHDTARRRLKLFVPLIEAGDGEAADLLLEFMADWLNDHTTITDRTMAAFVRNYERSHATGTLERWGAPAERTRESIPALRPAPPRHSGKVHGSR